VGQQDFTSPAGPFYLRGLMVEREIDPDGATFAYHALVEALENHEPFDAVVAAMLFVGVQWNGAILNEAQTQLFMKNLSEWLSVYFVKGRPQ
jgi:hypothetical protein